ncbi:MAG TPA: ABC transporter ATP-binding protein [Pyrinomonadaceae bacterium]|nr:ABC transporter ATP-binding protein [Pyrinomonadaceae bacterium]
MLKGSQITVCYGARAVLNDVSFELRNGEITVLLGANGAGKTTLIRAMNGTVPFSAGDILLEGRSLRQLSRRDIARKIAVVAQENETKFPVTVLEFILAGRFAGSGAFEWETERDLTAAKSAIAACDLVDFGDRMMNELSGGERQRVVLARAIATETAILLLDEPTANLDIGHQAMMFKLVRERCRDLGVAAAVITHDLNLASEFADQVLMLKDGRVFAHGTPGQTLTAENVFAVYGMNVLLDQNPASGRTRVTTIY